MRAKPMDSSGHKNYTE